MGGLELWICGDLLCFATLALLAWLGVRWERVSERDVLYTGGLIKGTSAICCIYLSSGYEIFCGLIISSSMCISYCLGMHSENLGLVLTRDSTQIY